MLPPLLHMHPSIRIPTSSTLSFSSHIIPDPTHIFLTSNFSHLSIAKPPISTTIRNGGGPRTYPGGVSKWQWKRMQAKKAKQLLRARLARERQIYEMRKRAELNAAVSELERPWEVVEKAPKLFSTTADEQLKVLADRFQKPGGFDLWSEKDGPELFESVDGIPSARFFPKGVVHSIKPYGRITDGFSDQDSDLVHGDLHNPIGCQFPNKSSDLDSGLVHRNGYEGNSKNANGKFVKKDNRRGIRTGSVSGRDGFSNQDSDLVQRDFRDPIGYEFSDTSSNLDSGLVRNGYEGNSRNGNGKLMKKDSRRGIQTGSDSSRDGLTHRDSYSYEDSDLVQRDLHDPIGYGFPNESLDLYSGLIQRNGHDENLRNAHEKFIKKEGRRGIRNGHDQDSGLVWRNKHDQNLRNANGKFTKNDSRRGIRNGNDQNSGRDGLNHRGNGRKEQSGTHLKVFDMSLQEDGSYEILKKEMEIDKMRRRIERK